MAHPLAGPYIASMMLAESISLPGGAMNEPQYFTIMEDHAVFRPIGEISLDEIDRLIAAAIDFARESRIRKLLVVTTSITAEIEPPGVATRYVCTKHWVDSAHGEVCIAMVPRLRSIDFEKIGVIIAENEGLRLKVFELEEEALAWLRRVECVVEDGKIQFTRG